MPVSFRSKFVYSDHPSICLIDDHGLQQLVVGGGRRRQRTGTGGRRGGTPSMATTINNLFYQINISFFFIFGGDNHSIYSLQSNAADNEVFVKALSA